VLDKLQEKRKQDEFELQKRKARLERGKQDFELRGKLLDLASSGRDPAVIKLRVADFVRSMGYDPKAPHVKELTEFLIHASDETRAAIAGALKRSAGAHVAPGTLAQLGRLWGSGILTTDQLFERVESMGQRAATKDALSGGATLAQGTDTLAGEGWLGAAETLSKINAQQAEASNSPFGKALAPVAAKDFLERRKQALKGAESIATSIRATKLLDSGIVSGFAGDFRLGLGKALSQAGIIDAGDIIANTEAFFAIKVREVGALMPLFGAGAALSDADREYVQKAVAGEITLNEKSIRKIMDYNERLNREMLRRFNADAAKVPSGITPFPLAVELPKSGDDILGIFK